MTNVEPKRIDSTPVLKGALDQILIAQATRLQRELNDSRVFLAEMFAEGVTARPPYVPPKRSWLWKKRARVRWWYRDNVAWRFALRREEYWD